MDENLKQETTNVETVEVLDILRGKSRTIIFNRVILSITVLFIVGVICFLIKFVEPSNKNNILTWIAMIVMVGIGAFYYNFDVKINSLYREHLESVYEQLRKLFVEDGYNFGMDYQGVNRTDDKLNKILDNSILGEIWQVISTSDNYIKSYKKGEVERKYIAIDIHEVFDAQVLFKSIAGYERRVQMPSIMTGLGILGTFLGLTVGLFGLDLNMKADDLSKQIAPLISSSGTAFITSLVGIAVSLLYTFTLNYKKNQAIRACEDVIKILYANIPYISTNELLMNLDRSIGEQKASIEQMAEDIASQLEASFNEKVPQALANSLSPNFQAIETGLNNVSTGLENMKKSFESFQSNTSKGIGDALIASASNEINALGNTLGKLNAAVNSLMAQNGQDREDHKELINTMSNMLSSSAENIVGLTSAFKDSAKGMVTSMDEKIKESLQSMQERQDAMMNAMNQTLETIQMTQGQLLTDTSNEFKASAGEITKLAGGFAESAQSMVDTVNTKVKDELELIHSQQESIVTTMNKALEEIQTQQTTLLGTIQEQLGSSAQDFTNMVKDLQITSHNLAESLNGETLKSVETLANGMKDSLVNMKEAVASITSDIRKDNQSAQAELAMMTRDLLTSITETTTKGLNQAVGTLHDTLSEAHRIIDDYAKKQAASMQEIEKLSAVVENILSEASNTVQNMDQTLDTSKELLKAMTEGNGQIVDNVASISNVVSKMEKYEEQMNLNVTKVESVIAEQQIHINNAVKPLLESLSTSTNANAQSIMAVRNTVIALEAAWTKHEKTYEGFTEELQEIFNTIMFGVNNYHEQLDESMKETMKEFDAQLSTAVSSLNASVSELVNGQESFKEVVDRRIRALQSVAGKL